jgi:hypothetical protein
MKVEVSKLDEYLDSCQKKADRLTIELNTKVEYFHFIKKNLDNEYELTFSGDAPQEGEEDKRIKYYDVFIAYCRKPHPLSMAKAMDMFVAANYFQSGQILFPACYLAEYSDKEVENSDEYRVGLCGVLGTNLKVQSPELKKN